MHLIILGQREHVGNVTVKTSGIVIPLIIK